MSPASWKRPEAGADAGARVIGGLTGTPGHAKGEGAGLANTIMRLAPRWFVVRDAHDGGGAMRLFRPRDTISWLRGPMTAADFAAALEGTGSADDDC